MLRITLYRIVHYRTESNRKKWVNGGECGMICAIDNYVSIIYNMMGKREEMMQMEGKKCSVSI